MGVTNKRKETVCNEYSLYLKIIYHFGNKVMLVKQLFEYAQALGLAKSYPVFHSHIKELVEGDILRQEPFIAFGNTTQLHMVVLRKYAIRFIEGKSNSQAVGAVTKNNNERIMVSIFKNAYILDKIIPVIKKTETVPSYKYINMVFKQYRSSLLYNKNQGLDYVRTWDKGFLEQYFNVDAVNYEMDILQELKNKKNAGLVRGSHATVGKGKKKEEESAGKTSSNAKLEGNLLEVIQKRHTNVVEKEKKIFKQPVKDKKLDSYNIDSMLNCHAYISQLRETKGVFTITILLFDIHNNQDIYKMGTQIASIFHMFFKYLKAEFGKSPVFKLKVGIVCFDEEAEKNMKVKAKKKVKDYRTKEIKGEQLQVTLKNWNITEDMQEKYIEVLFTNYDLTNRYLEGIKYSNLLRK